MAINLIRGETEEVFGLPLKFPSNLMFKGVHEASRAWCYYGGQLRVLNQMAPTFVSRCKYQATA